MARDWQELTKISGGAPIVVEQVRLPDSDIAIQGSFDLPPLARLSAEDQVFIMVFVRSHGSIKEMERAFGISYPTVKNRLNRISAQLELVETDPVPGQSEVLAQLQRGEITAAKAIGKALRMMWPPSVLRVRIRRGNRKFGLWLPLFLLWSPFVLFLLALLPLVLILSVLLWRVSWAGPCFWRVLWLLGFFAAYGD